MKNILLVVLLAITLPAAAQWTPSGNNAILTATGDVGVGTASPTYKMHVFVGTNGDGVGIGGVQSPGLALIADPTSSDDRNWGFFSNHTTHGDLVWLRSANSTADPYAGSILMALQSNGNLGLSLGSNVPAYRLHVNAGANGDGLAVSGVQSPGVRLLGNASHTDQRNWGIFTNFATNGDLVVSHSHTNSGDPYAASTPGIAMSLQKNGDMHVAGNISAGGTIFAKFQDVAECVPTPDAGLRAGTVVVVRGGAVNEVIASSNAYDTRVAGVISDQPGLLLGEAHASSIAVATMGRVKVLVEGPVEAGDLLVTSGTPGMAMRSVPVEVGGVKMHRPGTIIGKALEPLANGRGEILVLLSMQ